MKILLANLALLLVLLASAVPVHGQGHQNNPAKNDPPLPQKGQSQCSVSVTASQNSPCSGYSVVATGNGPGPITYQWCNGQTGPVIQLGAACASQLYCVTATCADGTTSAYSANTLPGDAVPPVISGCPTAPITVNTIPGQCFAFYQLPALTVSDNCDLSVSVVCSLVLPDGNLTPVNSQYPKGQNTIKCVATDDCGNVTTCSIQLNVEDNELPAIADCPQNVLITGAIDATGNCKATVDGIGISFSDNCPMAALSYEITGATTDSGTGDASGTMFMAGISTVIYTVTDMSGNKTTCQFTVNVACPPTPKSHCGDAIVTCFSGFISDNPSLGVNLASPTMARLSVQNFCPETPGALWSAIHPAGIDHPSNWNAGNMGQVFGVTIDKNEEVYVSATTAFGCLPDINPVGPGGPSGIYRIDASDAVSIWSSCIPNFGSGLGNITYNPAAGGIFYTTNHHDGKIYRLDAGGICLGSFDPFTPWTAAQTDAMDFVQLGERLWGIEFNKIEQRLYFSRWNVDRLRQSTSLKNEIWSVAIDATGNFSGTEVLEITLPWHNDNFPGTDPQPFLDYSMPVSDIGFSENGRKMLLSERSMQSDCGLADINLDPFWSQKYSHQSRVLEYGGTTGSWSLTPGHGSPIDNNLKFKTGSSASGALNGNNSAGGADYGYDCFDPATNPPLPDCDKTVWATGDYLFCAAHLLPGSCAGVTCPLPYSSPANNRVYGVQGNLASGGDNCNGYLIDLDNATCCYAKRVYGDLDIYHCGCPADVPNPPCDSLMVMLEAIPPTGQPGKCCYSINLKNLVSTPNLTKICMNLPTSCWIFNTAAVSAASGWSIDLASANQICFSHTSGSIPVGASLADIITFCLADNCAPAPPMQDIIFDWYAGQDKIVCSDTLKTNCTAPVAKDTCVILSQINAECGATDYEYCLTFAATNLSPTMPVYSLILGALPPGLSWSNCAGCGTAAVSVGAPYGSGEWIFTGFPLLNPTGGKTFCVKILSTTPITSPTTICFDATVKYLNGCCTPTKDWCATLKPCCAPCDQTSITATKDPGRPCCYQISLDQKCDFATFSHIDFDVLTPGVDFGSHGNDPSFTLCSPPTLDHFCIESVFFGQIPVGNIPNIAGFCLTNIDAPSEIPQQVKVSFWQTDTGGQDSVACDTILNLNCEYTKDTCLFVKDVKVECDPIGKKYIIMATVTNLSNPSFVANSLAILSDPTITPNPVLFSPPLVSGASQTVSFCYMPSTFPDADGVLPIIYSLKNGLDSCCHGGQNFLDEIVLPPCDNGGGCQCGTFSGLVFNNLAGSLTTMTCGNTAPFTALPCPEPPLNIWKFAGNFNCIGQNCQATVNWQIVNSGGMLVDPAATGTIAGTSVIFNVPLAWFPASGGTFTLILNGTCNGAPCPPCKITFIVSCQQLPTCVCKNAPGIELTTADGSSYVIGCGQAPFTPVLGCPAQAMTITSDFGCISSTGGSCPQPLIHWALKKNGGIVSSGNLAPPFSLNLPVSLIGAGGNYNLTLTTLCNALIDSCVCEASWTQETCPTDNCACGQLQWATYFTTFTAATAIECGKPFNVPCLKEGETYSIFGYFRCSPDSCGAEEVNWALTGPGISTPITGSSMFFYPYFGVYLPSAPFNTPGTYTVEISRNCGSQLCKCKFIMVVPPCDCSCDMIGMNVAQGFTTTGSIVNCKRTFTPVGLCGNDQVMWSINGVDQPPTTMGNAPYIYSFPSAGTYTVCMVATRTDPTGIVCSAKYCFNVQVNCLGIFDPTFCSPTIVKNGGFDQNAAPGTLGVDGLVSNWELFPNAGEGLVFVDGQGSNDDGRPVFVGKKGDPAGIFQKIDLQTSASDKYLIFGFDLNNHQKDLAQTGTALEFRLQKDAAVGSPSQTILLLKLPENTTGWQKRLESVQFQPNPDYDYLVVELKNDTNIGFSIVSLDNFSLCASAVSGTDNAAGGQSFRLFPNPNDGHFTLEMPIEAAPGTTFRAIDLTGRTVFIQAAAAGSNRHLVETIDIAPGLYFLEIRSNGRVIAVEKFVKN